MSLTSAPARAQGAPVRHLPHPQIRPRRTHRPRRRNQAPERRLAKDAAPGERPPPRPHLRRPRRRREDLARGQVGGGTGGAGLARLRRRLCVVLLQPGHARATGRFLRPVPQGSPHLLRRRRGPGLRRQPRRRVRERPAPRPPRRPAAQPPHPRRPRAAAIRAHRAHAGRTQGPGHRRAAQGPGRRQPRPVRRHHPVFAAGPEGVLADHRAGGEAAAPVPRRRRASAQNPRRDAARRRNSRRWWKT